jgi:trehalose 6-phosphate synthase
MNLVSKEGPLVNRRDGLIMLSENTGAHEEIGHAALSVNPFDVQEQADTIHRALTASKQERAGRTRALREIITARSPVDWIDDQLSDIREKERLDARATKA